MQAEGHRDAVERAGAGGDRADVVRYFAELNSLAGRKNFQLFHASITKVATVKAACAARRA